VRPCPALTQKTEGEGLSSGPWSASQHFTPAKLIWPVHKKRGRQVYRQLTHGYNCIAQCQASGCHLPTLGRANAEAIAAQVAMQMKGKLRARRNSKGPACRLNEALGLQHLILRRADVAVHLSRTYRYWRPFRSEGLSGPFSVLTAPFRCVDWDGCHSPPHCLAAHHTEKFIPLGTCLAP
jgi:hypothetical protein